VINPRVQLVLVEAEAAFRDEDHKIFYLMQMRGILSAAHFWLSCALISAELLLRPKTYVTAQRDTRYARRKVYIGAVCNNAAAVGAGRQIRMKPALSVFVGWRRGGTA